MSKETAFGVVRLSDEDRALLKSVTAALAKAGGGKGKAAAADDADTGEAGEGEAGEGEAGEGEGEGEGDDFESGEGEGEGEGEEAPKPTRDDVRKALAGYAAAPGCSKAGAIKLMQKHGGSDALSKLKEAKFPAVIDAATKAAKAAKAKAGK